MTKLSKAKLRLKARMARNLRNLFGTYLSTILHTTQGTDNQRRNILENED